MRTVVHIAVTALLTLGVVMPDALGGQKSAAEVAGIGLKPGERASEFQLADQYGKIHTLQSLLASKGAMLLFLRSADW